MRKPEFDYSAENLRKFFHYDPLSGVITWRVNKGTAKAGDRAGSLSVANGYLHVCILRWKTSAHRVAWLLHYGKLPESILDHINGDKTDNRISNLREVSVRMNNHNRKRAQVNSELGILGVTRSASRYAATIKHHGKKIWIGTFDTPELAHEAYLKKKREIHEANTL